MGKFADRFYFWCINVQFLKVYNNLYKKPDYYNGFSLKYKGIIRFFDVFVVFSLCQKLHHK